MWKCINQLALAASTACSSSSSRRTWLKAHQHLLHGLQELALLGITAGDPGQDVLTTESMQQHAAAEQQRSKGRVAGEATSRPASSVYACLLDPCSGMRDQASIGAYE
jgi:hypothetical protein